ncbi:MarR family transcriptional regulator [Agrobacterium rosae]|uniref:MarR family transcriptional regulator n=1 Tax=Agrobacterium rosae TaxID=1972867 RepID=UPI0020339BEE|nr:helix-turn-helix domain-containing protein [Agrobacterium rosae]MCM2431982.1 MarR family transcriptional regulator [Agrobacterium rosae]
MLDKPPVHFEVIFDHLLAGACLKMESLVEVTGLPRYTLTIALGKMVSAGLVERRKVGCYQLSRLGRKAKKYGVIPALPKPPTEPKLPADGFRQRLWAVMRMSGPFAVRDIVMVTDWPLKYAENAAHRYVSALKQAGYVVELPTKDKRQKRFRLVRNSGQLAPVFMERAGLIRDPNTNEVVSCAKQA